MKFILLLLPTVVVTAQKFIGYRYCYYEQWMIEETDQVTTEEECYQFCYETDEKYKNDYIKGEDMCCDFEMWSDGS